MRLHEQRQYSQGPYKLINPNKYFGNDTPKYKSSFELRMMEWADKNKNVIRWAYEPYYIEYKMSVPPGFPDWTYEIVDNKKHKYYIDFHVELLDVNGKLITYLLEIKPKSQTIEPKEPKRKTRASVSRYVANMKEFIKNTCKWATTNEYCRRKGFEFRVLNEDNLFF